MGRNKKFYPLIIYPELIVQFLLNNSYESERLPTVAIKVKPQEKITSSTSKKSSKKVLSLIAIMGLSTAMTLVIYYVGIFSGNWLAVLAFSLIVLGIWTIWGRFTTPAYQAYRETPTTIKPPPQVIQPSPKKSTRQEELAVLLQGKVLKPTGISRAQQGVSEEQFFRELKRFFPFVQQGVSFQIQGFQHPYSADFILQHPSGLSIDVEIDEPYVGNTKKPHHGIDQGKDDLRNQFFVAHNWIVVRFSEEQVVRYPRQCCKAIAQILDRVVGDKEALSFFKNTTELPKMAMWTVKEARQMAKQNYRQNYLN